MLLTVLIGLAANCVLFFAMFRLLGRARHSRDGRCGRARCSVPSASRSSSRLSTLLLGGHQELSPAFQAFGIALILLVWINYFSRVVLYAAAWAHTSREARATRESLQPPHAVKDASACVSPTAAGVLVRRRRTGRGPDRPAPPSPPAAPACWR